MDKPAAPSLRPSNQIPRNFSVRLKTPYGRFIFGYNVAKADEYWIISGKSQVYRSEEHALKDLRKRSNKEN